MQKGVIKRPYTKFIVFILLNCCCLCYFCCCFCCCCSLYFRFDDFSYCKYGNFRENFIFANSVKRNICHVKIRDFGMIYLHQ